MAAISGGRFGDRLRRLREARGLTQEQLAERAVLSPGAIAALESGMRRPHPRAVRALVDALGLSRQERAELARAVDPRSEGAASTAPSTALGHPSHLLTGPPMPLVGRGREVAELHDLLTDSGVRLVMLTGPGGVGKTSLAMEVAMSAADGFADGSALIELAPIADVELVLPTVARTLGLTGVPGVPVVETLRAFLSGKRYLLVLDNLEHLLPFAPQLADLLASCTRLRVLATSRAPLRLHSEREYPVGPLPLPEMDAAPIPDVLMGVPAVALFVQRVRAVAPGFALTDRNARAVADICARLDGLPLAIELAAARMRSLSPTELLARLDQTLPLLTGGARDLPERQRTMRSAIGWSYQLLAEPQWRLLNRLAVFRGGWDLEAAEAVGAANDILEEEVLDLLSSLVEHSLVVVEIQQDGFSRYRMLVPVQEYAEERLIQSGEARETRARHAGYFLELAEEAEFELAGPRQVEWLERLERENDNLRAALSWALDGRERETALRLAGALWHFWLYRGYIGEGRRWLDRALDSTGDLSVAARAKAHRGAGMLAWHQGDYERADVLFREAMSLYGQIGDREGVASLLHHLGLVVDAQGDQARAEDLYEESLALHEALGNKPGIANAKVNLGFVAQGRGDYDRARSLFADALALRREMGDGVVAANLLNYLGTVAALAGDYGHAAGLLAESVASQRAMGNRVGLADALNATGMTALGVGDLDGAEAAYRESLWVHVRLGHAQGQVGGVEGLAELAAARGDVDRAARLWGAAEELRNAAHDPMQPGLGRAYARARGAAYSEAGAAARVQGRAMTLEGAVEYALSATDCAPPEDGAQDR